MTERPRDREGAAMNRLWKTEQAKLKAAQQNENMKVRIMPVPAEQPAATHHNGPAECETCTVKRECKSILRLWHQHAARPILARAWCGMLDRNAAQMVCLSQLRQDVQPEYTSIQGYTIVREGK